VKWFTPTNKSRLRRRAAGLPPTEFRCARADRARHIEMSKLAPASDVRRPVG
jgi:hypothetical protein